MSKIQPALCGGNGVASDLHLVVSEGSGCIDVFLGAALLERVRCSEEALQYKMLVGRLVNAGWGLGTLRERFGHDARTMKRWAAALSSDDVEFALRAFGGRGTDGKVTPPLARYVQQRYRELAGTVRCHRRLIAAEVEDYFGERLSGETLRRLFREADREDAEAVEKPAGSVPGEATGCACAPGARQEMEEATRNRSPDPACPSPPILEKGNGPARPVGLHHAGMILFALLLELFCRHRPWAAGVQTQWIGQVLQGAVNIEQSRLVSAADLSRFTGPVVPGTDPQRAALHGHAFLDAVMDVYAANARLLPDGPGPGPGKGGAFYYDPHSKEYTGHLKVMKDWCGSRHGVAKVVHLDMVHTESGRPCFAQHYSPYYDLRERFFMTLALFDRLFAPEGRSGRIFVLDRGIYGLETLRRFGRDAVVTWEKGYRGDGWEGREPEVVFRRVRPRNHARDLMMYLFECREEPWRRDPAIRRILVRATNPKGRTILVAVLCSDPGESVERIVWLIFNRWIQENDFKYLDRHFGLGELTSYASKAVAEVAGQLRDMPVDSPEYRELKARRTEAEKDLARQLLLRENCRDRLAEAEAALREQEREVPVLLAALESRTGELRGAEPLRAGAGLARTDQVLDRAADHRRRLAAARKTAAALRDKLAGTDRAVAEAKDRRDRLDAELSEAVRSDSRLRLLVDGRYRLIDTRCKELLDALRIVAANMFASLVEVFRPIYGNYRNDHAMLRNLTRADGFVHAVDGVLHVRLWIKGRFQPWQDKAFRTFLAQMSELISTARTARQPQVRVTLLDAPPTW